MTTQDDTLEHEPLPVPQAVQQEPAFDSRGSWQDYQREHYKWRTGLRVDNDTVIPEDEGEPPPPTIAQIALEVLVGLIGSGPGASVGRLPRLGIGGAAARPLPSRVAVGAATRPSPPSRPPAPTPAPTQPAPSLPKSPGTGFNPLSNSRLHKLSRAHHSTGWRRTGSGKQLKPTEPRSETPFLEGLLQQRVNSNARGPGQLESVAEIQAFDFEIPGRVYRAHQGDSVLDSARNGLRRAVGGNLDGDDYLAAIIKHTARQGGSGGEVLSLTADRSVASKFAKGRNAPIFDIDTHHDRTAFRTIVDILLKDAERLVLAKKVTRATVLKAIDNIAIHREFEVFYVNGDVPANFLVWVGLNPAAGG